MVHSAGTAYHTSETNFITKQGANRNVPVNFPTVAQRDAAAGPAGTTNYSMSASLPGGTANLLSGSGNHASSDAPFGLQQGYIFDAVLHAGRTVRNYGFLVNNIGSIGTIAAPVSDPFAAGIIQVAPLDPALQPSSGRWRMCSTSPSSGSWTYIAVASTILKTTTLGLAKAEGGVKFAAGPNIKPQHNAAYWTKVTAGFDFSQADQVPPCPIQQGAVGRPDERQAISSHQGPSCRHE